MATGDPTTRNVKQPDDGQEPLPIAPLPSDRFQRWQATTMQQLSYAIGLILALASAALGFEVSLLLNQNFDSGKCVDRVGMFFSLISLVVSIFCGVVAVVTRLYDFRLTMRVAREDSKPEHQKDLEKLCRDRYGYKALGNITWCLFWLQIGSFGVGMFFAILRVAALAYDKLG